MRSAVLVKVLLPGFLLAGLAVSGNAAAAVIVGELFDAETLLGTPGEVALTSNEKGNLVSRHAKSVPERLRNVPATAIAELPRGCAEP